MTDTFLTSHVAEEAVLSAMLLDPDVIPSVRQTVTAEMFADPSRSTLFRILCEMTDQHTAIDPLTIVHTLERSKQLDQVGGREYLVYLSDVVPTAANVRYHAKIVREKAQRRAILKLVEDAAELIHAGQLLPQEIAARLQQELLPVTVDPTEHGYREITRHELEQLADEIEKRGEAIARGDFPGLPTGYYDIDSKTHGFRPHHGELVIFGAGPKVGKSLLVANIALNLRRMKRVGGQVSAEMARQELIERMIGIEAQIELGRLSRGTLTSDEWQRFFHVAPILEHGFHIDDQAFPQLDAVIARACDLKNRVPELEYLIFDYLQLITNRLQGRRGDEEISATTKALRSLCKKLKVVGFAPAQCNFKEIDAREDKRPQLRDIQGSSGPAQDANFVGLLYNPLVYDPTAQPILEINFAASRRTPQWVAYLELQPKYQRLVNRGMR